MFVKITNPLDVIEQMTYMMFIHNLDDSNNLRAKEAARLGLPYQSIFAEEIHIGDRTIAENQLKRSIFHDLSRCLVLLRNYILLVFASWLIAFEQRRI